MAKELRLPLPSDTSSLSLEGRTIVKNDNDESSSHHSPILTFSSPRQPAKLEMSVSGIQETSFPNDKSVALSLKEPKTSPQSLTASPISQEVPEHETIEKVSGCSFLDKGTELLGSQCELVRVSDKLLNLDDNCSASVGIETGKQNGNFQRNKAIIEDSGVKISGNQYVATEMGKARKTPKKCVRSELQERNKNLGGFLLHKLMNSRYEGLNRDSGLALTRSVKVEVIDETALIDVSAMFGKIDKKRERKREFNGRSRRFVYSRIEMEELRFINVRGQKSFWREIYNSFGENVKREYDQMGNFRDQNPGPGQYYGRGILGMATASRTWNDPNLFVY